ncbi:MAG TPA: hypothetical protein G4O08_13360 [Anaerolineae bacterium]|nr:hypothetical protein [Anaerolineae bacterium]
MEEIPPPPPQKEPEIAQTQTPEPELTPIPEPELLPTPNPDTMIANTATSTPQPTVLLDGESQAVVAFSAPICPLTQEQLEALEDQEREQALHQLAQLRREAWLELYLDMVNVCLDELSDACMFHLGLAIYDYHNINLNYYIEYRLNNPIEDFDEFRMISDTVILGGRNPVSTLFLDELGLDVNHYSNYETVFIDALRRRYPETYYEMEDKAMEQDLIRQYIDDQAWDDIFGPMYGGAPDAYIGDYPYLLEPFNISD